MFEVATACALLLVLLAAALVGWSRAEARAASAEEEADRFAAEVHRLAVIAREEVARAERLLRAVVREDEWDVGADVRLLRAALAEDENADE